MSFLGKEYHYDRAENFEAFINSIGIPKETIAKLGDFKPSIKLEKDGDTYISTSSTPKGPLVTKFKSGVQLEEMNPFVQALMKMTFIVDGNTVTQNVVSDLGTATFKREYDGDVCKVTVTSDKWDGVAYRYYKA